MKLQNLKEFFTGLGIIALVCIFSVIIDVIDRRSSNFSTSVIEKDDSIQREGKIFRVDKDSLNRAYFNEPIDSIDIFMSMLEEKLGTDNKDFPPQADFEKKFDSAVIKCNMYPRYIINIQDEKCIEPRKYSINLSIFYIKKGSKFYVDMENPFGDGEIYYESPSIEKATKWIFENLNQKNSLVQYVGMGAYPIQ